MNQDDAYRSFRRVQDQLEAARFAVARVLRQFSDGVEFAAENSAALRPQHLRDCAADLELTYSLRLFSAFESVVRSYWQSMRPSIRPRRTPVEVVMNRVASRCFMFYDVLNDAHKVREYRNELVHQGAIAGILTFGDCKSRLATYVSYLPREW